jgi:hypothetical protein
MPSRCATTADTFGIERLGAAGGHDDQVDVAGGQAAAASALAPASKAMSVTVSSGPANRRLTMPTRLRIHSSLVSTCVARSSLVTTLPG